MSFIIGSQSYVTITKDWFYISESYGTNQKLSAKGAIFEGGVGIARVDNSQLLYAQTDGYNPETRYPNRVLGAQEISERNSRQRAEGFIVKATTTSTYADLGTVATTDWQKLNFETIERNNSFIYENPTEIVVGANNTFRFRVAHDDIHLDSHRSYTERFARYTFNWNSSGITNSLRPVWSIRVIRDDGTGRTATSTAEKTVVAREYVFSFNVTLKRGYWYQLELKTNTWAGKRPILPAELEINWLYDVPEDEVNGSSDGGGTAGGSAGSLT